MKNLLIAMLLAGVGAGIVACRPLNNDLMMWWELRNPPGWQVVVPVACPPSMVG